MRVFEVGQDGERHYLIGDVPEAVERVILKLLEKQPEARVQSATELRTALKALWPAVLPPRAEPRRGP